MTVYTPPRNAALTTPPSKSTADGASERRSKAIYTAPPLPSEPPPQKEATTSYTTALRRPLPEDQPEYLKHPSRFGVDIFVNSKKQQHIVKFIRILVDNTFLCNKFTL